MRCEKCNVEIICKTNKCPLCQERLDTSAAAIKEIRQKERAYPIRPLHRPLTTTPFNLLYLVISINIMIICIATNAILTPNIYWSVVVLGIIFYLYFFIRYTILSYSHFNSKIFSQAIALMAISLLVQQVYSEHLWIYEYIFPLIVFVSTITIGSFIIINIESAKRYIVSLFILAIIGLTPLMIVIFIDDDIIWPSVVVAITSGSIILTTIISARKILWQEVKRIFHL